VVGELSATVPVRDWQDGRIVASGEEAITLAAQTLKAGKVIALPTDTVYGLAASLEYPEAIAAIYRIKGRPESKPLPILLSDRSALTQVTVPNGADDRLLAVADRFWPGALTVALPAAAHLPVGTVAPDGTAGIRVPDHYVTRSVLAAAGGAAAVTSANRSGALPARSATAVIEELGAQPDLALILDAGETPGGTPSTVVTIQNGEFIIVREGAITAEELRSVWSTDSRV
jgi:L-threonylcarbamoyladenylate synthase